MVRYFVDENGIYVGGFDGCEPHENLIEVSNPPEHGSMIWDGSKWNMPTNKKAFDEILRLEALETPRRIAEAMHDDAGGTSEGRAWLKANREKIAIEREKL